MNNKEKSEHCCSQNKFLNIKINTKLLKFVSLDMLIVLHYLEKNIHKNIDVTTRKGVKWFSKSNYDIKDELQVFSRDKIRRELVGLEKRDIIKSENFESEAVNGKRSYCLSVTYYEMLEELNLSEDYINED